MLSKIFEELKNNERKKHELNIWADKQDYEKMLCYMSSGKRKLKKQWDTTYKRLQDESIDNIKCWWWWGAVGTLIYCW